MKSILHEKDIRDQLKDEGLLPSPTLTEDSIMGKNVLDNIMENLSSFSKKGRFSRFTYSIDDESEWRRILFSLNYAQRIFQTIFKICRDASSRDIKTLFSLTLFGFVKALVPLS